MRVPRIPPEIFERFRVDLACLFGSRAKGHPAPDSDYDIAVLFEKGPSDPLAL